MKIIKVLLTVMLVLAFAPQIIEAQTASSESAILRISMISQTPDPVSPGSYAELRFRVDNVGGRSEDYVYMIETEYPFSLDDESQRNLSVGSIEGYSSSGAGALLYWKLRVDENAVEGAQNRVRISYFPRDNPSAKTTTEPFSIRIRSAPGLVGISELVINPLETAPGNSFSLSMKVDNLGSSSIENVRVRFDVSDTPFTPISSTNQVIISRIQGNGQSSVGFNFFVNPDAELKVHAVPVTLEYTDSVGDTNTLSIVLGIPVNAVPSYIINLEDTMVYTASQKGRVVISVSNTGKSPMNFVVMELLDSDYYEIIGPSRTYLGNLRSDDFETGQFRIYSSRDSSESIALQAKITYRDDFGRTYEEYVDVPLRIYSIQRARELGLVPSPNYGGTLFLILILIAVGVFFYRRSKKKKNKR